MASLHSTDPTMPVCIDAVRFGGLLFVFHVRVAFGQSYFSKPWCIITGAMGFRAVRSKMKRRTCVLSQMYTVASCLAASG